MKTRTTATHRFLLMVLLLFGMVAAASAQRKYLFPFPGDSIPSGRIIGDTLQLYGFTRVEMPIPFVVQNPGQSAVTINATISGAEYFLDEQRTTKTLQIALPPGEIEWASAWFYTEQPGVFTALLTVNDGSTTDSLVLITTVEQLRGNFLVNKFNNEFIAPLNMPIQLSASVFNMIDSSLSMTYTLSASSEFTLTTPPAATLWPRGFDYPIVEFLSATAGTYTAQLFITDGATIDTVSFKVVAKNIEPDSSDIIVEGTAGSRGEVYFYPSSSGAANETVRVRNLTASQVTVSAYTMSFAGAFSITDTLFTLTAGSVKDVRIDYQGNPTEFGNGLLMFKTDQSEIGLALLAFPSDSMIKNDLDVPCIVDFGIVDTTATLCKDIVVKNLTTSEITLSNILLSGMTTEFALNSAVTRTLPANGAIAIEVCFTPGTTDQQLFDVLEFEYSDGAAKSGLVMVSLTGRSNKPIRTIDPFPCLIGWYDPVPKTPIGTEKEFTIDLFNMTPEDITIVDAMLLGFLNPTSPVAFEFLQQLPIVVPAVRDSILFTPVQVTVKYKPTTQTSTAGVDDVALLEFKLISNSGTCPSASLIIVGEPTTQSPPVTTRKLPLFGGGKKQDVVNIINAAVSSTHAIEFTNNLNTPVQITGASLQKSDNFELKKVGGSQMPMTLQPGASITLEIEFYRPANTIYHDQLTIHGSHEQLGSSFPVYGAAPGATDVDATPTRSAALDFTMSPNPSFGQMLVATRDDVPATIEIFDAAGRLIATQTGTSKWMWDGTTASGTRATPGTYFVKVTAHAAHGTHVPTIQKAIILR